MILIKKALLSNAHHNLKARMSENLLAEEHY